jgi:nitrate reductase (NAD(P)H)
MPGNEARPTSPDAAAMLTDGLSDDAKDWNPKAVPRSSSLRNTPDATPDTSLRDGSAYSKPASRVAWTEVAGALEKANGTVPTQAVAATAPAAVVVNGKMPAAPSSTMEPERNTVLENSKGKASTADTAVDPRDVGTPDEWVPRHPALVRLTGKHPFNCEPPAAMLLDRGFITPVDLHYVRNHGAVPRLTWESHSITIDGLVGRPRKLSMDQLAAMPTTTVPVTLTCAGNRRKEQNMTKKTIGFNWGAAGTSCTNWTGVRLADLLRECDIDLQAAKHVHFLGAQVEGLPNGTYGTSIPISLALDHYGDVLIAFEQSGARLAPDHGFPVRTIVPGWIGGRMVKWLERITVSDKPSENHYHFFDNRILPPHVDAELAKSEGWWYRPDYLFNELNINSTITYPDNGELMVLNGGTYTIKGYAYSGGGRKVTRVEISFDGGTSWKLCKAEYPEERASHAPSNGKYWCWMFWEYTVDKFVFLDAATVAGEIRCRAWDESNNTQPDKLTWNLMGMGNNCQFRVKVQPRRNPSPGTAFALEFLHPTLAGTAKGGWMSPPEPVAMEPSRKKALSSPMISKMVKSFTMAEVAKHDSENSAWFVMDGGVYDGTAYLKDHPGGAASIIMNAGSDATDDFTAIHSEKAKRLLEQFYIGDLVSEPAPGASKPPKPVHVSNSSASLMIDEFPRQTVAKLQQNQGKLLVALNPKKWIEFELLSKIEVSHDTRLFTFKLPSAEHQLGLPVGYHMFVQATIEDKMVMRAYTPVSANEDLGTFTLCIKVYFKNVHPKFPDGGKVSQYMEAMNVGDMLRVKGPLGHFEYVGRGCVIHNGAERHLKHLGLICGGTGLTPAYQIMKAVCRDPEDLTEIHLLYANQTEQDILMREELDAMAAVRENIHVWYTVDRAPEAGWTFSTGFVNEEMLRAHMPAASENSFVGMCGPPGMIKFACIPNLQKLGYKESDFMSF